MLTGPTAMRFSVTWPKLLPDDIEVATVQLPGREWRITEEPLHDLVALAEHVENGVVDVALTVGEFAIGRHRACEIGLPVAVFCGDVHEDEFTVFANFVVFDVVEAHGALS